MRQTRISHLYIPFSAFASKHEWKSRLFFAVIRDNERKIVWHMIGQGLLNDAAKFHETNKCGFTSST